MHVCFVCTGNICRSPIAERLFRARVNGAAQVAAASAGVAGLVGHPMDALSALALRELGGDPDGHVGRELTEQLIGEADLILTAGTAHRSAIVRLDPPVFRWTFTLREFGRLGAGLDPLPNTATPDLLRVRVAHVASRRGTAEPVAPDADDIADPFGAPVDVARRCAQQVARAVDAAIALLGLAS